MDVNAILGCCMVGCQNKNNAVWRKYRGPLALGIEGRSGAAEGLTVGLNCRTPCPGNSGFDVVPVFLGKEGDRRTQARRRVSRWTQVHGRSNRTQVRRPPQDAGKKDDTIPALLSPAGEKSLARRILACSIQPVPRRLSVRMQDTRFERSENYVLAPDRIWFRSRQVRAHGKRLQHVCTDQNEVVRGRKMLLQFISWTWSLQSMECAKLLSRFAPWRELPSSEGLCEGIEPSRVKAKLGRSRSGAVLQECCPGTGKPLDVQGRPAKVYEGGCSTWRWKSVGLPLMTLCTVTDISDVELWCIKWSSTNVTENPVECEGDWRHGRCLTFAKAQAAKADTTHVRS